MQEKTDKKNVINNIKSEVSEYYRWKNMIIRYIIVWFLLLLLILQFVLPGKKKTTEVTTMNNTELSQELWFMFFDEPVDLDINWQIQFDRSLNTILSSNINYLYKISQYYLPDIQKIFGSYDIPEEFSYIALAKDFQLPYRDLDEDIWDDYWLQITSDIDETKNISKSTYVFADYLNELYDDYEDRNLVLISYLIWDSELQDYMDDQDTSDLKSLYLPDSIMGRYYDIMAYSYLFQNISDYIDTTSVSPYKQSKTKTIKISDQKDLQKWAQKNGYSFKEVKELNPWILWNSLPKWKREILVNK